MGTHRAVIFDKDGTLLDFHATWDHALAAAFLVVEEDVRVEAATSLGFDLELGRVLPGSEFIAGTADDLFRLLGPYADPTAFSEEMMRAAEESLTPMPGADELVSELGMRRVPMAVATNDSESAGRIQMAQLGWSDAFEVIIGADSGHGAKPGPGMVLAAAGACGVPPDLAIMVGDSPHDLLAARAAGALAVMIGDDPTAVPHADVRIEHLGEVPDLLEGG